MEALVSWVTQIIMFILLASIIDLLVPQTAMKKYIKLVVGLLLILILLKPVFALFQHPMESALDETIREINSMTEVDGNIENLIDLQKTEIESTQHAYILEQMAVQLKAIAEVPLRDAFALEIVQIEFSFHPEDELHADSLEEIIVYTEEATREGAIDEVERVVIDSDRQEDPVEPDGDQTSAEEFLQAIWEAEQHNITVVQEGGTF